MPPRVPNVFIVGAQKCGTTSVYRFLVNQERVAGPLLKEPNFLSFNSFTPDLRWRISNTLYRHNRIMTYADYIELYRDLPSDARWIVDGSASYLYAQNICEKIKTLNPDARVIVLVRNPVDRAFSEFRMQQAIGAETASFRRALEFEIAKGHDDLKPLDRRYIWHGRYDLHLAPYLSAFDRDAIHIDCVDRPGETLDDVFRRISTFLGIEGELRLGHRENVGTHPRYPRLNNILYKTGAKALLAYATPRVVKPRAKRLYYKATSATLHKEDRATLWSTGYFDVERVEAETALCLDHWRSDRDAVLGGRR